MDKEKVVIIGSGPAGYTAAIYAARAGLRPKVLSGPTPGGQLIWTTDVENFPGFVDGILGPDLMENMKKQSERFGANILPDTVTSVDFKEHSHIVNTDNGQYTTECVIIATGAEANWLNLENEQRLRGKGVSACATCDGFFFRDKHVVVVGGGDSAMEEAVFLTKFASKVSILNRSSNFKASKIMLERAQKNEKIEFVTNVQVVDVLGDNFVTGVNLKNVTNDELFELACEGMFLAIGHSPVSKIFSKAGIEVNERGYIITKNGSSETNISGVFAAGDIHDHKYRQAVTAAGAGCVAAIDAERYLSEKE